MGDLPLPTLSIIFRHRPTGGESYGFDNHLAASELAPSEKYDVGALSGIPPRWRLVVPKSTPFGAYLAVEYNPRRYRVKKDRIDPYPVGRIGLV